MIFHPSGFRLEINLAEWQKRGFMSLDRVFPWTKRKDKKQRTDGAKSQENSGSDIRENVAADEEPGGDITDALVKKVEPLQESLTQKILMPDDKHTVQEGKSNFVLTKNIMLIHTDEKITGGR